MTAIATDRDTTIVERYLDQPARMPAEIREQIQKSWGGKPVQLYALCDLDGSMNLARTWVGLGAEHIGLVQQNADGSMGPLYSFERSRIKAVRKAHGLSATTLTLLGEPGDPALAVVRYTNRQRRAMENLQYVIEEQIKGREIGTDDADSVYVQSLAHAVKDAQNSVNVKRHAVLWRLMGYLRPYRWRVAWGMFAALAMMVVTLIPPYLTGYMVDKVIQPFEAGALTREAAWQMALLTIIGITVTYALRAGCVWLRRQSMSTMGEFVSRDLRNELYEHLQKLSVSYFSSKRTGSLISRVSSDTDRLWEFVAYGIIEVSLAVLMLVGLGVMLVYLDLRLGLLLAASVPVFFWVIYLNGCRMQRIYTRVWRKWSAMTDVLSDTIPGMRVVKAFHQEDTEKARFGRSNEEITSEFNRIHAINTVFWPMLMFGMQALLLLVWIFGVPRVLGVAWIGTEPGAPLSAGTFIALLLYTSMFMQPIDVIAQMSQLLNRATSSAHRVFEVLDTEPQMVEVENAVKLEPLQGRVTFENVSFSYDGVRQVIHGISLDVMPGEMIGLVGPSGAGKTTITNLIVRFYETSGGRILIDGVDLKKLDSGHFRRQVGMVLQDPYLFHGSVLENIRYGIPDATLQRVVEAAQAANAHDFVCKLPHGYDTMVGERGHTLSGGERQRISIARAILTNPRILILDEATSSVDTETEGKIQEALDRLVAGKTVFAIAHRLSTLKRATRLLVIDDGRISEQGTHAELLMKEDGTYRKLCRMQQELQHMYAV